jgi:hypothetical protein
MVPSFVPPENRPTDTDAKCRLTPSTWAHPQITARSRTFSDLSNTTCGSTISLRSAFKSLYFSLAHKTSLLWSRRTFSAHFLANKTSLLWSRGSFVREHFTTDDQRQLHRELQTDAERERERERERECYLETSAVIHFGCIILVVRVNLEWQKQVSSEAGGLVRVCGFLCNWVSGAWERYNT